MRDSMRFLRYILGVVLIGFFLCSCGKNQPDIQEGKFILYQVEEDGSGLRKTLYEVKTELEDTVGIVKELLDKYKNVDIRDFQIKEKQLSLYFSTAYKNLHGVEEVLQRAAIVKTLCQGEGVE